MCDARISDLANQLRQYWLYDIPRHMPFNQVTGEPTDVQINNYGVGSYDIADGFFRSVGATTTELMYWVTTRAFEIQTIGLTCPESSGPTLTVVIGGSTEITADRTDGTWTVNATIAGSTDTVLHTLATPISVAAGVVFRTTLVTSASITAFGYGLGCRAVAQ